MKMSHTEKGNVDTIDDFDETSASFGTDGLSTNIYEEDKLMQQNYEMTPAKVTDSPEIHKRWPPRPSTVVHILVAIFGVSAWIGVNGIFIQLPLLTNSAPESWGLAACLVVAVQVANIAPLTYSLLKKAKYKINESYCILGMLAIETIVMGLLALLYDKTSIIAGKEYSTSLFVLTFFIAAVSCTSSVLFMPYLRNFKEIYLISYFIGEGLSGVLPSIVALIQGISDSPNCNITNVNKDSNDTFPRFPPEHYFLFLLVCLFFSLTAFCFLEKLPYIKKEKISAKLSSNKSINQEDVKCHCQKQISVLTEGSISENDTMGKHVCTDNFKKTDGVISNAYYTQSKYQLTLNDIYLYILLSVICLLANGFLPGLQPYSCLSYGSMTYHLSATFSQIANPTACFLALWFLPRSRKIINSLSVIIFIASGYVLFLSLASPNPPLQGSKVGAGIAIFSWVLLVGLISYVKLLITSVFRRKSEKKLFHVGVVMQAGSALGAVLSFILINYTSLLHEYKPCND